MWRSLLKPMRSKNIKHRLYLVIAIILIGDLFQCWYGFLHEKNWWEARISEKGVKVNDFLAKISAMPIQTFDYNSIIQYIEDLKKDSEIAYVIVSKNDGSIITKQEAKIKALYREPSRIKAITSEIRYHGHTIGHIETGIAQDNMISGMRQALKNLSLVFVVHCLVLLLLVLLVRSAIKSIESFRFQVEQIHDDQSLRPIEIESDDEIGKLARTFNRLAIGLRTSHEALQQKIKDQSAIEKELRNSKAHLKSILGFLPSGIVLIDPDSRKILEVNPTAEEIIGLPADQIIDQRCNRFFGDTDAEVAKCPFAEGKCQTSSSEAVVLSASGNSIPVLKSATKFMIDGEPRLIESFIDISKWREVETQRDQLHVQLQHAQKMEAIGTLAGGIAHDFNNILFSVIGFSELILDDAKELPEIKENISEVLAAARRAKSLIQQILTFSRKHDLEQLPTRPSTIIKEALKLLRASLPTTIAIENNIVSKSVIMADPTQIHQILMNLCTNAGHAMQADGGTLRVALTDVVFDGALYPPPAELVPGRYVQLEVKDSGQGIPSDVMERIFDPFFTTKAQGEGTGMGLAVVHGIIKSHHGEIIVQSELDKGTSFKVFLPIVERQEEVKATAPKPVPTGTGNILVVDDEVKIVAMIKRMVERLGYTVTNRLSSLEALETFKVQPDEFDLIITDMTMPNMTGDQLAREILQIRPEIPIILCTGFTDRMNEEAALEMGISAFINKPMGKQQLAEAINSALNPPDKASSDSDENGSVQAAS